MSMNPWTEEHEQFRSSIRDYVERQLKPNAEKWEAEQSFPREIFTELGELGYLGIRYPEEYGGSNLDYWYTVIFCEELVRSGMLGLAVDVMPGQLKFLPIAAMGVLIAGGMLMTGKKLSR